MQTIKLFPLGLYLTAVSCFVNSPVAADELFETPSNDPWIVKQVGAMLGDPQEMMTSPDVAMASHFEVAGIEDTFAPNDLCGPDELSYDECGVCEPPAASTWRVNFVPYGWLYEIHGSTTVRGRSAPVNVNYRDTLRILSTDLDFIATGKLEIENDRVGLIVDGSYLKVGLDNRLRRLDFSSAFQMTIVDIATTYNLLDDGSQSTPSIFSRFDLLGGVRIWNLEGDVAVTGPRGRTAQTGRSRDWIDPFVGARFSMPVAEETNLRVRGDVGGFGWGDSSRLTWRFDALLEMQCSRSCALRAGYRILDVDNRQGSGGNSFAFDVQFRGPVTELVFQF